jgi:hypothetical protein
MKFKFYNKKFVCIDYRKGTILCETEPFDPEEAEHIVEEYREKYIKENTGKFYLSVYYQEFNSGVIDHIVGYYIDNDLDGCIEKEVKEMIESGYIDEGIDGIEKSHDEYEEYFWEKIHKEELSKNN